MSRRAVLVGSRWDGLRLVVDAEPLPATLALDGHRYRLRDGKHARYVAVDTRLRQRFDSEAKAAFVSAIGSGATVEQAAAMAGFAACTVYANLHRDPAFAEAYAHARRERCSKPSQDAASTLLTLRVSPETAAVLEEQAERFGLAGPAALVESAVRGDTFAVAERP